MLLGNIAFRYGIQRNMIIEIESQIIEIEELLKHRATGLLETIKRKMKDSAR
jgi:hypothetical protein